MKILRILELILESPARPGISLNYSEFQRPMFVCVQKIV